MIHTYPLGAEDRAASRERIAAIVAHRANPEKAEAEFRFLTRAPKCRDDRHDDCADDGTSCLCPHHDQPGQS